MTRTIRLRSRHVRYDELPGSGSTDALAATKPFSASSLVERLCKDYSTGSEGSSQTTSFAVVLRSSRLEIGPITPRSARERLVLEGSWTIESNSENASTPDQFTIDGEGALLGVLLEAVIAQREGKTSIDLDRAQLLDSQLGKLSELIKASWWHNLTRSIQVSNAALSKFDTKLLGDDPRPRIYVPEETPEQYQYYSKVAKDNPELRLDVRSLPPPPLTPEYIQSLNARPGLLALATDDGTDPDGNKTLIPLPYVVPGGRFNEMYGWDTYFTVLGLLEDDFTDLCAAMLKNFCFCIQHYGKIFNANRTYYLGRSQPPFLTSMGSAICEKLGEAHPKTMELARLTMFASLKEYYTVWTSGEHFDGMTGLSRYHGEGKGFPPECEPHHFDDEIGHIAAKYDMSLEDFAKAYDSGQVQDGELDEYLKHDRAGRESGHDTTYRFVGRAAHLAPVDLNSCLYKYETDIACMLDTYFDGAVDIPSAWQSPGMMKREISSTWLQRAAFRRGSMTQYLWCEEEGMFVDYDTIDHKQMSYENATALWPLWSKIASQAQAESIVRHGLSRLETYGGLMASTEISRGKISPERPQRQWDYPYGWAPHQMLAWVGLTNYGFNSDAERLLYRWLSMVTKTFTNHNGLVVEKYDVTSKDKSHVVEAEYGNQGSDFDSEVQTG